MSKAVASGIIQNEITVPAYGTGEVQYLDIYPNYFRVTNYGSGAVLCGLTKTPTDENYDFSCAAQSMKVFADVFARRYLYIYNPTGSPVRIKVDALYSEFDPLILALANIDLDFSGISMETSTEITGFKSALPAGTNNIGKVNVASLPATAPTAAKQDEISTKVGDIFKQNYVDHVSCFNPTNYTGDSVFSNGGGTLIHLLTNDGDTGFMLHLGENSIQIKPGESITDLKFDGTVKLSGSNYSARAIVSYTY